MCPDWLDYKYISTGQKFLKMYKNLHLSGHTIKQRIIEYYTEDMKKDDRERSRSQGESHQGAPAQINSSAFQPHQRSFDSNHKDSIQRNSLSRNSSANRQSGVNLSNHKQNMHQNMQVQSSSGTYLSGHSGEMSSSLNHHQQQPAEGQFASKFLSPMKRLAGV